MKMKKSKKSGFVTYFCKGEKGPNHKSGWKFLDNGNVLAVGKQQFGKYRISEALIRVCVSCHAAVFQEDASCSKRGPYFNIFKQKNGKKFWWNLKSGNHKIVASSSKSFNTYKEARENAEHFQNRLG